MTKGLGGIPSGKQTTKRTVKKKVADDDVPTTGAPEPDGSTVTDDSVQHVRCEEVEDEEVDA